MATLVCYGTLLSAAHRAATGAFAKAKTWSNFHPHPVQNRLRARTTVHNLRPWGYRVDHITYKSGGDLPSPSHSIPRPRTL